MVSDSFIFRSGKYQGKTVGLVKKINPSYIDWVLENKPEMLEEKAVPAPKKEKRTYKEVPDDSEVEPKTTLENNTNFLNEGPNKENNSN